MNAIDLQTIVKNPLYPSRRRALTMFEAWLDLVIFCAPENQYPDNGGSPGYEPQYVLSKRWSWTPEQTRKFLLWLIKHKICEGTELNFRLCAGVIAQQDIEDANAANEFVQEVVNCYNFVFKRSIMVTPYRHRAIKKRLAEGKKIYKGKKGKVFGLEQFQRVFEYKKKEWHGTDMAKHLEIETLVAEKHFFKYLDQARLDWSKNNPKPKSK